MQRLHEFLTARQSEIISHWSESIRRLSPKPLPPVELIDHLPDLINNVAEVLRQTNGAQCMGHISAAIEHGKQRYRLGFNLSVVVWEYAMLYTGILELAKKEPLVVRSEEANTLFESVISGIADAVTQFTAEHETALRNRSNENFAFIAHELRNPLTAALLAFHSLQKKGLLPSNRQVEIIQKSLNRTNDLVEKALFVAAGSNIEITRAPFKVRDLVAEASIEALVSAEEKNVRLIMQSDGDQEFNVDHRLILSALNNLIRNAVKFTRIESTVQVRWHTENEHMVIEVEDECGGLPPDKIEKLFLPFVKAGTDQTGFGLGLAIVKQAAEAHGGSVQVKNVSGTGCIFSLVLPI